MRTLKTHILTLAAAAALGTLLAACDKAPPATVEAPTGWDGPTPTLTVEGETQHDGIHLTDTSAVFTMQWEQTHPGDVAFLYVVTPSGQVYQRIRLPLERGFAEHRMPLMGTLAEEFGWAGTWHAQVLINAGQAAVVDVPFEVLP